MNDVLDLIKVWKDVSEKQLLQNFQAKLPPTFLKIFPRIVQQVLLRTSRAP
jgi:hypothetical protein